MCAADPPGEREMNRAVMKLFRIKLLTASLLGAQSAITFFILGHKLAPADPRREMNRAVIKSSRIKLLTVSLRFFIMGLHMASADPPREMNRAVMKAK